jgi:general secretion pathway protein A
MYANFYGLQEKPFALDPNPRFFYMADSHKEALSTLVYALRESEGWALLTGEPGMGKTTIILSLLRELGPRVKPILITNSLLTPEEFYQELAQQLSLDIETINRQSVIAAMAAKYEEWRNQGKCLLLIVDEAHDLSASMLEELRLLGNLNIKCPNLINIFLVAQEEFWDAVKRAKALSLVQRLRRTARLQPLNREQTAGYIKRRLEVSGGSHDIFSDVALDAVHEVSGGIPRLINSVCDDAMLIAFSQHDNRVSSDTVIEAYKDNPALQWRMEDIPTPRPKVETSPNSEPQTEEIKPDPIKRNDLSRSELPPSASVIDGKLDQTLPPPPLNSNYGKFIKGAFLLVVGGALGLACYSFVLMIWGGF